MFCTEKDKLLKVIEIMKLEKCDYGGADGCDCKYGYEGQSKNGGEQNGCPELSNVIELLQSMTDIEYHEILDRNKNCVDGIMEKFKIEIIQDYTSFPNGGYPHVFKKGEILEVERSEEYLDCYYCSNTNSKRTWDFIDKEYCRKIW